MIKPEHTTIHNDTSAPVLTVNGNVTYTNRTVRNSSGTFVTRIETTTSIPYFETGKLVPTSGDGLESFVPESWRIHQSETGDVNGDKLEDLVAVLGRDDLKIKLADIPEDNLRAPRLLVVALKEKEGGYTLSLASPRVILCRNCGADHDNPLLELSLKNGTIIVKQERLTSAYKIDFYVELELKQNEWMLINGLWKTHNRETGYVYEEKQKPMPVEKFYIESMPKSDLYPNEK